MSKRSDFNEGIDYAFDYIEKNIIGHMVNGSLVGVITKEQLETLKKNIPRRCSQCDIPCGNDWCSTKSTK
jgi:hypothetical protein